MTLFFLRKADGRMTELTKEDGKKTGSAVCVH